jgi:hypothetical protein
MRYQVIDNRSNVPVGKPMVSKQRARAKRERLDLEYGAVRYRVQEVQDFLDRQHQQAQAARFQIGGAA